MKKNLLIITGFVILSALLIMTSFALFNAQKDLIIFTDFTSYTLHVLSVKNYEKGHGEFDLKELVVGNERGYCRAVGGFWDEESRECLNVDERYCRLITGSMIVDEDDKTNKCILE